MAKFSTACSFLGLSLLSAFLPSLAVIDPEVLASEEVFIERNADGGHTCLLQQASTPLGRKSWAEKSSALSSSSPGALKSQEAALLKVPVLPEKGRCRTTLYFVGTEAFDDEPRSRRAVHQTASSSSSSQVALLEDHPNSRPGGNAEELPLLPFYLWHAFVPNENAGIEESQLMKRMGIVAPLFALALGGVMLIFKYKMVGLFMIFFGAQTIMTLYIKNVLSACIVSQELGLSGFPAPFLVTGLQQIVSFCLLGSLMQASKCTSSVYQPRSLDSVSQMAAVACLALSFVGNIGLNNLSVSLLDISVNVAIRSTTPLWALMIDCAIVKSESHSLPEAAMVLLGTICSACVVFAKSQHTMQLGGADFSAVGVCVCLLSVMSSAMELVMIKQFATSLNFKLNSVDAVLYVAIPATIMLAPLVFFLPHNVPWHGHGMMTDWEVFQIVLKWNPMLLGLALFSGVLAAAYNCLLYSLVQSFSPYMAAISSNFNKVAFVAFSVMLGLELSG
ncbi:unnamed protein product [Polarella glacialis]|uniref:Sugar phosphate transporter domain-containing protein n=1 Tax=Polarella glacialis TaxID=89957 RepID=A0A813L353_POLGL|nr:unnamed protein product [Polarella glacialis]